MTLVALVALTMVAFAANSILNRLGVSEYGMDPMGFAAIRVAAGAVMLWALVLWRGGPRPALATRKRLAGAIALATYMVGFSWAYLNLGAGLGALILFGVLQIVIFGWAVIEGQRIAPLRWAGAAVALIGLGVLLWPSDGWALNAKSVAAMIAAAIGWATYTLLGRHEQDPLGATAGNFLICLPIVAIGLLSSGALPIAGVITAIFAGAVTSGLGYALWYRVLPSLATTMAGISQLSVPVIAVFAGAMLLNEPLTLRLGFAGLLVLGGITISLFARK